MHRPRVLFLELNEFNEELLMRASLDLKLSHIQKILSFPRSRTYTEDTYESDFLEPWVQWINVHTGLPSSSHHIKHLGDVPALHIEQLWNTLSSRGITSGIWGAMNASRNNAEKNLFFLPDPWTAEERAYPDELGSLLDPLRYISKNYTNCSCFKAVKMVGRLLKLLALNGILSQLLSKIPSLIKNVIRFKGKPFVLIAFAEYLSTLLFLSYKKRYQPDFSLIFINTIAHIQHHHWKNNDYKSNPAISYGLQYVDLMIGKLMEDQRPEDIMIVANALSQKNTQEEKPWILYRQTDQKTFLHAIGIKNVSVEEHMTHDAHLFFKTPQECAKAKDILEKITICGEKLFCVESYSDNPLKLFYKIIFTDEIPKDTCFLVEGNPFRFFDLFQAIVKRTGKHIQEGSLFCNVSQFPPFLKNHEIFLYTEMLFKGCR